MDFIKRHCKNHKITLRISISKEYARKAKLITDKLYWCNKDYRNAKYVSYDCQWIPVDSGWKYFHVLTDTISKKIITIELTDNEEKETNESFFEKNWNVRPEVITT